MREVVAQTCEEFGTEIFFGFASKRYARLCQCGQSSLSLD